MSSCNFEFLLTDRGRGSGSARLGSAGEHVIVSWVLVVGDSWGRR